MRPLNFVLALLLAIFTLSFLIHTNTSFDQDLGRHIKLGEIILKTGSIPGVNLFSYTHPNFPFFNHHWLSEVVFYVLYTSFGVFAITYLKIVLIFSAILLIVYTASKKFSFPNALLAAIIFLPAAIYRTDERPEIFGLILFSSYLTLYLYNYKKKHSRILFILPLLQLAWINLHITFVYGLFLLLVFAIDDYLKNKSLFLFWIFGISLVTSIVNPHGIHGLIYPFSIFKNYGYSIQENQNLFLLATLTSNIFIKIFWIQFWILIIAALAAIYIALHKRQFKDIFLYFALTLTFTILTIAMIRNLPFFSLVSILCFSSFLHIVGLKKFMKSMGREVLLRLVIGGVLLLYTCLITTNWFYNTFDQGRRFEFRNKESYKSGVNYMLNNNLKGPIFNNFDIGGYLDFTLYPHYKVFVDNRPEAYPNSFFQEYKQAQTNIKETNKLLEKYGVQTIIFSHTDGTPWASEFLQNITKLNNFKAVYIDYNIVILTKGESNANKIFLTGKLEKLLGEAKNYRDAVAVGQFASYLGDPELSQYAIEKTYQLNPDSCATRLALGSQYLNSSTQLLRPQGINILKSTGICPYTNELKEQIRAL